MVDMTTKPITFEELLDTLVDVTNDWRSADTDPDAGEAEKEAYWSEFTAARAAVVEYVKRETLIDLTDPLTGNTVPVRIRNVLDNLCSQLASLQANQAVKLWTCPDCAFSFAAEHENEGGGYSCPVCESAALEKEVRGWKDIAESNLAAYNAILPSVSRKLMDINDPEVCRRLAEAECGSEIGVGFETIEPTNDEQQRLAGEMMAQASLGHKRFCVGTHEHEGGELEYEWVDWKEAFARLRRLHD